MSKAQQLRQSKRQRKLLTPTLQELFAGTFKPDDYPEYDPSAAISLGVLAQTLNIPPARLFPVLKAGYLTVHPSQAPAELSGRTLVTMPPPAAVLWMRSWFQPARAKILFSLEDLSDLLGVSVRRVAELAALGDIPATFDPALDGMVFSVWAAKRLLQIQVNGGQVDPEVQRFDRQALLWLLLNGDPARLGKPPRFEDSLEAEIARVAKLPEDVRTARATGLWEAWTDAVRIAEAQASSEDGGMGDAAAAAGSKLAQVRVQATRLTPKFARLRDVV